MSLLLHPCSWEWKRSTWEESSARVAAQPPSVSSSGCTRRPVPWRSWLTSTSTESSPQRTAKLSLVVVGGLSWNIGGFIEATGAAGSLGYAHDDSCPTACGGREPAYRWGGPLEPGLSGSAPMRDSTLSLRDLASRSPVHAKTNETIRSCLDGIVADFRTASGGRLQQAFTHTCCCGVQQE